MVVKNPLDVLQQYYGYTSFRDVQGAIIQSCLDGKDTLALLPTGGGKSLCFQIPALCVDGMCLVVSPLIALMKDQVMNLKKRNISAEHIYTGMSYKQIEMILSHCIEGKIKFLYISPERLQTDVFGEYIKKIKINFLAIDEAHCISQWGYDFRPPYLRISDVKPLINPISTIALTASATPIVQQDIVEKLEMKDPAIFRKSFARKNLSYSVFEVEDKPKKMLDILNAVPGTSIVYVNTRKKTKSIAQYLLRNNIPADFYHAGLPVEARSKKQENWASGKTRVIVATNAFGMGIDKGDVRTVIHTDIPNSLEYYYQEAGRAGRDEKKSYAILLYQKIDLIEKKKEIEQSFPPIEILKRVYQSIGDYLEIPVDGGCFNSYNFEIEDFCAKFQLSPSQTLHSLKKLQEENLIQMNESFFTLSKVFSLYNKINLYDLQIKDISLEKIIQAILRLYGGRIFSEFIEIKEIDIAKLSDMNREEVVAKLEQLHQMQAFIYEKKKEKPQLVFLMPRQRTQYLPIHSQKIKMRKDLAIEKMNLMEYYANTRVRCRTQIIQEYFGEISDTTCGTCDFCIEQKKKKMFEELTTKVIECITYNKASYTEVLKIFSQYNTDILKQVVRDLLEKKEIKITGKDTLEKMKNNEKEQ
ncbi:MAG: ATP-dependent DNA helicase RecQ [Chitinophagaceae bacterium]|nr:ATP-dependent DNA helicase RecQ [Chitinophagaceae bacterium]